MFTVVAGFPPVAGTRKRWVAYEITFLLIGNPTRE
jgi:hypothetical protein